MEQSIQSSDWTGRFAALANQYCRYVEGADGLPRESFVVEVARLLSSLYSQALSSPLAVETPKILKVFPEDKAPWEREARERISAMLGDWNSYWEYFDPYDESTSETTTLGDDLADVYSDLSTQLD